MRASKFEAYQKRQILQNTLDAPTSTLAAYGILLAIASYYLLHHLDYTSRPLSELLWKMVIYMTPNRVVAALDNDYAEAEDDTTGFASKVHADKGNAMRRILGLDKGGLMGAVRNAAPLSAISGINKGVLGKEDAPPGLGNWDHSCYQNSVLQGLASLRSLPAFLGKEGSVTSSTKSALKELASWLNSEDNAGRTLWTPAKLKNMSSWQQQDAHEYYSKVLDEVDKDVASARGGKFKCLGIEGLSSIKRASTVSDAQRSGPKETDGQEIPALTSRIGQIPDEVQSIIARNPLDGLLAQRVGCQSCGYVEGLSLVPFNCLTVPLGKDYFYDIRQCLDDFTALEPINGVECAKCTLLQAEIQMNRILETLLRPCVDDGDFTPSQSRLNLCESVRERIIRVKKALEDEDFSEALLRKCQISPMNRVSTIKSRQAVIARAPKALTLHINRSVFNEFTGQQSKNYAKVSFPKRLGLGDWCLGGVAYPPEAEHEIENWNIDPLQSMLAAPAEDDAASAPLYELRAVVTHYGRHENGHYVCYRQSPFKPKLGEAAVEDERSEPPWWRLSDEDVTKTTQDDVLAQGGVFMLFYEIIEAEPMIPRQQKAADHPTGLVVDPLVPSNSSALLHEEVDEATTIQPFDEVDTIIPDAAASAVTTSTASKIDWVEDSPEEHHETSNGTASLTFRNFDDIRRAPTLNDNPIAVDSTTPLAFPALPKPGAESDAPAIPATAPSDIIDPVSASNPQTAMETTKPQLLIPPSSPSRSSPPVATSALVEGPAKSSSRHNSPSALSPRTGRGGAGSSRSGKAMQSVAGYVQAN